MAAWRVLAQGEHGVGVARLRDVIDPEMGVNVVDLGFIRDVHSSCGPLTHPE